MFEQKQPLTTKWKKGPFFGYESRGETESSKFPVEAKAKRGGGKESSRMKMSCFQTFRELSLFFFYAKQQK